MKRVSIKDAFVGEPTSSFGIEEEESDEAVVLSVRGGEIVAVVPADTSDDDVVESASLIRGALRLENERVLTFEIHEGASSAFFEDESAQLHRRRQESGAVGLSAIAGHDYMSGPRTAVDIMTRGVLTAAPDMPTDELAKLLSFHNISGMPVVDGEQVVGIVSEADVIGKSGPTVGDIMSTEIVSVPEGMAIEQIAALMAEKRVKRVPVMAGDKLLGVVSRADIVKAIAGRV